MHASLPFRVCLVTFVQNIHVRFALKCRHRRFHIRPFPHVINMGGCSGFRFTVEFCERFPKSTIIDGATPRIRGATPRFISSFSFLISQFFTVPSHYLCTIHILYNQDRTNCSSSSMTSFSRPSPWPTITFTGRRKSLDPVTIPSIPSRRKKSDHL